MLVCKEPQSYTLLRKEKHVLIYTRQQTHIASETRNFPFIATDLPSIPTGSVFKRYIYIYTALKMFMTQFVYFICSLSTLRSILYKPRKCFKNGKFPLHTEI